MLTITLGTHPNVPPTYGDLREFVKATQHLYADDDEIAYSYDVQGEIDGFTAHISAPTKEDQ